jgi:hypothetical protein
MKALHTLAAVLSALVVATPVAFGAARTHGLITNACGDYGPADPQYARVVDIPDARHMALIANACRHGVSVWFSKPIASRQSLVGSHGNGTSRARVAPSEGGGGGLAWTYPGVLAGLSLALALMIGGIVVAARRRLRKPHAVGA